MQKPFAITHAMREEVATKLTMQAVAQHGPRIAADLEELNSQFWAKHCAAVADLQGLDKAHWADLIQAGTVTATASCEPHYLKLREGQEPSATQFVAVYKEYKAEARNTLVARVLGSTAFEGVSRYLAAQRYEGNWVLNLKSPTGAVPRMTKMAVITDPVLESLALMACADLAGVIEAALAFRAQAMSVLMACRTSRQVEDLFPEAAKLLPQPVKEERALAPTELAANVRNMLSKGVPPVLAHA